MTDTFTGLRTFLREKEDISLFPFSIFRYTIGHIKISKRGCGMTKKELIDKVAKATGLSKSHSGKALDAVMDSIKGSLKKGKKVTLPGFGSFSVSSRKARMGRNPRTGEAIKIAASKLAKFSPGKALKDLLKK
jgi:DNA-binding protein HU-beta